MPDRTEPLPEPVPGAVKSPDAPQASLWKDAFHRMVRRVDVIIAALLILVAVAMALFPTLFTDADPRSCSGRLARQRPDTWFTGDHPLGTDAFGCDFAAKLVYGTRPTLLLAVSVIVLSVLIGLVMGILSGYYGGWTDAVISRALEVFMVVPFLLGALLLLALFRGRSSSEELIPAVAPAALALAVFGWMEFARYVRAATIETRNLDYVAAARCLGARDRRIMFRHIMPNAIVPVTAIVPTTVGGIIVTESVLAVLGLGIRPPATSWGILLAEGTGWAAGGYLYLLLWPMAFLLITVFAFATFGDALRDALDPKLR
ncbi:ABC transporter permease [Glycomyces sp. YM15]|uniref:ABC transporter permease n=1 Tax=Glycomyces sp. YM15 TaxID=2800446 RepID=UPI001963E0F3|nr:ABC transporter permease [Glycomyces sp. YM15]